jgi:hypothetical protein
VQYGSVAERPMAADCKSAGFPYAGSNPARPTSGFKRLSHQRLPDDEDGTDTCVTDASDAPGNAGRESNKAARFCILWHGLMSSNCSGMLTPKNHARAFAKCHLCQTFGGVMLTYNPDKMLPKEAVAPFWGYVYQKGKKTRTLGFRPSTKKQRQMAKEHHTKKAREFSKEVIRNERNGRAEV